MDGEIDSWNNVHRSRATASMPGLRSRALIWVIGEAMEGERSFSVLRPVPQPSSVTVSGTEAGRSVKTFFKRSGSRASSRAWRILPSVS